MRKLYNRLKESKLNSSKTGIIIISVIATIWFLVRVIPKPTRAAYPCMKTAAPLMSGLVIYLLSVWAGGAAYLNFKRNWIKSNYLTSISFIVALLIFSVFPIVYNNKTAFSYNSNQQLQNNPANTPFGSAIGYYPGRVVWAYNPDATNENCKNVKGDYWYQNTSKAVVQKMMDDAILNLTNSKEVKEGWDKLFRNFNIRHGKGKTGYLSGEKVVIKINTTNTSETQYEYGARMDATPEVLYAVLKQLIEEVGVKQQDIVAGDPFRIFANPLWNLCHTAFPDVHYIDGFGKNGREQTKISVNEALVFSDKKIKSRLPADYMDADYLINIPCLKSHSSAGISVAAKNHQGSVLASDQSANSQSAGHLHYCFPDKDHNAMNQFRHLVDYMGHEKLGGNTVLFIVDAIWSGTDWNGAVEKWGMKPFNYDFTSSLFLSQDGVAIESVTYDFLYAEYLSFPHYNAFKAKADYPVWPAAQDYIHQAASSAYWPKSIQYDPEGDGTPIGSLGVTEHWNNSDSKQYSNNLTGISGGIHLVSVPQGLVASEPLQYDPVPLHFETTSINQLIENGLRVYPNPFSENLIVELSSPASQNVRIEIYDNSARLIYNRQFSPGKTIQLTDLGQFHKGTYIMKIILGTKTYTARINKI
jgi:hypothetical protein